MKLTQVPASDLGCKPNRPKSVFWSELLGTRRYTPNSFFIIDKSCIFTKDFILK